MRKLLLGLAGCAAILSGALVAAEPAQAQGFSISIGSGYGYGYGSRWGGYYPYRRVHNPYPIYRRYPVHRHYHPIHYGPSCRTRITRVWDGWGYVTQRRRVCW